MGVRTRVGGQTLLIVFTSAAFIAQLWPLLPFALWFFPNQPNYLRVSLMSTPLSKPYAKQSTEKRLT